MIRSNTELNCQQTGSRFEAKAQAFLENKGFGIIQSQFKIFSAEIDLIMHHPVDKQLIFIEVRARRSKGFGGALLSISPSKCRKIIQAAEFFLQEYPQFLAYELRFDVIAFEQGQLVWHPNAFNVNDVSF
jgi:putative endonuclease